MKTKEDQIFDLLYNLVLHGVLFSFKDNDKVITVTEDYSFNIKLSMGRRFVFNEGSWCLGELILPYVYQAPRTPFKPSKWDREDLISTHNALVNCIMNKEYVTFKQRERII